jgi:HSP20 family protein
MNKPDVQAQPASREARVHYLTPLANIVETADGYVLEAEMPGVTKSGLEITVENGELTIVGRRQKEHPGQPIYRESRDWDYRRVFELDPSIDVNNISAKVENGLLRLHLPKAESVKPRKITVD